MNNRKYRLSALAAILAVVLMAGLLSGLIPQQASAASSSEIKVQIRELKEELPQLKILILEPFVLKASATEAEWEFFDTEVRKRAEKAKAVAEKYNLAFVPLQDKFDEAAKLAANDYWLGDGVHPTTAGHELIKREWLKCFETMK